MIFKIQGDFNEDNFSKILNKLCKYFKFIYTNGTLYIALGDVKNKQEASVLMSKTFRPVRSYYIKEINEKNIMNEEQSIMEWCRDNFVQRDLKNFEKEHQDDIKDFMKSLDVFEKELNKIHTQIQNP